MKQIAILLAALLVAPLANALSCAGQFSLDGIDQPASDEVAAFLRESKRTIKASTLVVIGDVSALSEPVRFDWHQSRRADIRVQRSFRKPANASQGTRLAQESFPVFVPASGIAAGQRVLIIAHPESEAMHKWRTGEERAGYAGPEVGIWPDRMWLAHDACWNGTYLEGTKNYQALVETLEAMERDQTAPGELVLRQTGGTPRTTLKIQAQSGGFERTFITDWEDSVIALPRGKYWVTWPKQAGFGFSCFHDKPSPQVCAFEIESGFPTHVYGQYLNYAVPILRVLGADGNPLLTTASLDWYGDGALKGLIARIEGGLSYTVREYPVTRLALKATWRTSADVIEQDQQCKSLAPIVESVAVRAIGSQQFQAETDMQPGIVLYETHINTVRLGWLPVRFEGDLAEQSLSVSAACEDQDLHLDKLPATVFVPQGQTIEYMLGSCCSSKSLLINAATTVDVSERR